MRHSANKIFKKVATGVLRGVGIIAIFTYAFIHARTSGNPGNQLFDGQTLSMGDTAHADVPPPAAATGATAATGAGAGAGAGGGSGSGCSSGGGSGSGCDSGK